MSYQISAEITNTQKSFGPIVQEGRSLLKKTEGACPKRITTTHGEYTALQWTTVGGARNLHRKSNCHNSCWITPFSLIKDLYLTNLNKKKDSAYISIHSLNIKKTKMHDRVSKQCWFGAIIQYPTHPTVLSLNLRGWVCESVKKSYTRHDMNECLKCMQEGHINNYFK